ncbi:hypothetical protein [uncultured Sphingorhabdus sp.]|uniref:hypothetical protein n=1 Tax=uncultured Sphingorhabdus sp. TaxID=1686106 RepID=UPI002609570E|nr:hypothetical protein [uncultured Sphingorhabdus sp.]HMS20062.1 hypothetical protein [Sphingorhabdus sp.]
MMVIARIRSTNQTGRPLLFLTKTFCGSSLYSGQFFPIYKPQHVRVHWHDTPFCENIE